ncbi:GSCOCT00014114001.2-RA-CDS [Cotesia congregata]|uniref:Carboxylic ester hydrolase n=1 Tax=Cotesia congregata TaxID=51543 RepID=A0A8J2EAF8_COTCN|nr:GSCOCT00014114001.2-RA-CDS [Cotesia congregata]CAG5073597.1 carboxylesterase clade A member 9 [Cotesia congregata]
MIENTLRVMLCVVLITFLTQTVLSSDLPTNNSSTRPIVDLELGQLQGIQETNVDGKSNFYAFRGIPFAKSTAGELRFKDPEPAEAWSGVRDASKHGNTCPQKDFLVGKVIGGEDCLNLNVYTRDLNPEEPLAVLVWIHGGAFIFGSGNDDIYGPDYFMNKDIILVTINYRLGMLGFLNLDDEEATGNQGLKDQVMALKWVKQNIKKFGGDPNKVTIFGESAGAACVHYLTISPLAEGLFQKAIIQSGVASNPWASVGYPMKEEATNIAENLGRNITDNKELIEFLRNVDLVSLVGAEQKFFSPTSMNFLDLKLRFVPSVDSKSKNPFLSIPIKEAVKSGIKVPHIIGYTSKEAIIFVAGLRDDQYAKLEAERDTFLLHPEEKQFLQERNVSLDDITKFFMGDKKFVSENIQSFVDVVSARLFFINIHDIIKIQSSIPDVQTYLYKFDYYSNETTVMQKLFGTDLEGTAHGEELFFLFYPKLMKLLGFEPIVSDSTENIIKQRFIELWTNFAKNGDPNSERSELISVKWKPVDDHQEYNCLEVSEDLSMIKETNILDKIQQNKSQN